MFTTLRARLISAITLVAFVSLLIASGLFYQFLSSYSRGAKEKQLKAQAQSVAQRVADLDLDEAQRLMLATQELTGTRVFFVNDEGNLVGPRGGPRRMMGGGMMTPDEAGAPMRFDKPLTLQQYLPVLGRDVLLVSMPVKGNAEIKAVVLTAAIQDIRRAQLPFLYLLIGAAGLSFLIALAVGLLLARSISRPVHTLTVAADKVAEGDLSQEVDTRSVDEIGRLSRTFNYMVKRVRRAYEAQRDFTSNVSHELRTPLTSIEGYSEALLEGVPKDKKSRDKALHIINDESKRLKRLTESLLTLSRIDAGALELSVSEIGVRGFLEKVREKLKPQIEEARTSLTLSISADAGRLHTDADRLEQVILNLLDNALRNSPAGAEVVLRASRIATPNMPAQVELSVTDQGPGIPADQLPKIFDRFYRIEKGRAKTAPRGAGLGLAIAKEMTEALGGTISVKTEVGEGTTFTLSLPT